jgi:hypothetical protein
MTTVKLTLQEENYSLKSLLLILRNLPLTRKHKHKQTRFRTHTRVAVLPSIHSLVLFCFTDVHRLLATESFPILGKLPHLFEFYFVSA